MDEPRRPAHINRDPRNTVAALFDTTPAAVDAMNQLLEMGFPSERLSLIANNATGEYDAYFDENGKVVSLEEPSQVANEGSGVGSGSAIGALVGGSGGALIGLGLLAIPGVGPIMAAGPLVAAVFGGSIGALTGGFMGALAKAGVPKERAEQYAEGVRRGGTLLLLETDAKDAAEAEATLAKARAVLEAHHPVDIDRRARAWSEGGWSGYDPDAGPLSMDEVMRERERNATARDGTRS